MKIDLYLCQVHFQKAFDTVKHGKMKRMLQDVGIDEKDSRTYRNMYWKQNATVQIGGRKTEWIEIKKGRRLVCILSRELFSPYSEKTME